MIQVVRQQAGRQPDRLTGRQAAGQAGRLSGKQAARQAGRHADRQVIRQEGCQAGCDMLAKNPRLRGYSIFPSGKSVFGHVPDYVQESARALELSWHSCTIAVFSVPNCLFLFVFSMV